MAMKAGDASSAMEILELFNEAVRVNPTSPVLYINKASFLLQVGRAAPLLLLLFRHCLESKVNGQRSGTLSGDFAMSIV